MSDITLNTQSITGNHNFVPPGTDWNLGSGSKKWNGGYFGTIIADNGIPAGTAATGGDKIGQIRFSINPNIEPGYLALNGQEVNRDDYPNLWAWVQQQVGFLVEEGEWQSISSAHNGNVGKYKYSVGDGTSTFRLPNLGCWVRGGGEAGTANGVGENLDAGLPNITGNIHYLAHGAHQPATADGVFGLTGSGDNGNATGSGGTNNINFDASRANSIYGNADTVQPESIVGIWLVKAYHVPVDNMGNTITVNGVPPDENGNITIEVPQPTIAPEAEAVAGTNNAKFMTPLRVAQAIEALAPVKSVEWYGERGDGSNGALVVTSATTLEQGIYNYTTIEVQDSATLTLGQYTWLRATESFVNNGTITADGKGAAGGAGGGSPKSGGTGLCPGNGGAGNHDGHDPGAAGGAGNYWGTTRLLDDGQTETIISDVMHGQAYGAGGGGGRYGGTGGKGGGGIVITAPIVTNTGTISAKGAQGGNGGNWGGGGGGGAGGSIIIAADTINDTGTVTVAGGAGGGGETTGGTGGTGYLNKIVMGVAE